MSQTVLIVDDDPLLQSLLGSLLRHNGYQVQSASDIQQAVRSVQRHPPDAAIVDVDLGESESGLQLLVMWRLQHHFPIMVLSSRGTASDRITGLELGALDYVVKPFEPKELLLRLKLILARGPTRPEAVPPPASWRLGDWLFDTAKHLLVKGEVRIELTTLEFNLLHFLVARANTVVSREQILNAVHHRDRHVNDRAVDVLIGRLRKKLPAGLLHIQAVRGSGYMLSGEIAQTA